MSDLKSMRSELVDQELITSADWGRAADEALQAGQVQAAEDFIEFAYLTRRPLGAIRLQ